MSAPHSNPLRSLLATSHRAAGWLGFRLGRLDRARWHFERVLQLVGDDFAAYVHLGRVAYRLGDYAGWRRECGHACRTSPRRYAALRNSFELYLPRAAGAELGDPRSWSTPRLGRLVPDDEPGGHLPSSGSGTSCRGGAIRRFGDDFASEGERARFRKLGPISPGELGSVDLDELTDRLVGR